MRIAIDVTSCAKPERRGIANYGFALVPALTRVAPENEIRIAVRQNRWFRRHYVREMLPGRRPKLLMDATAGLCFGRFDVFHGLGVRVPKTARFARVVTLHDLNVIEFPELSTEAWKEKRGARIRQSVDRADAIIVLSRQGAEAAVTHLGLDPGRLHVVPHGVDVERFRPASREAVRRVRDRYSIGTGPYVTCIGRLSPRKNQDTLVEAFCRAGLDDAWRLVLVGVRATDREGLDATLDEHGITRARVVTIDWVSDEDLPVLLSGASVHACPSRHEGFGMPVLEAQACATPVLASNRGGLVETTGDAGIVTDPEDVDAMAAALARLAGDEALRRTLGERGRVRVEADYTWDQVARKTLDVYDAAIAAHRAGATLRR